MSGLMVKAAVVHEFGKPLAIEEVPVSFPGTGQVLVKMQASGVCHTDLHAAKGDWKVKPQVPFVPGHEGAGIVATVGEGVKNLKDGDRVGIPWLHDACGMCDYCLTGCETLCARQHDTGYSVNGCFAEYVLADAAYVGHLPKEICFINAAPILCAGVTTYKGLKETEAHPGEWVAIVGAGGLGHMAIQYAKAMGFNVAAVDISAEKLLLAEKLGADLTILADDAHDPALTLQKKIGGAHAVLATAVSPTAFQQSIGMLRSGGTCVIVGLPPGSFKLPIFDVVLKRLTIRGSIVGTRHDLKEALEIAADRNILPNVETQPLEAINDVFKRLETGDINGRVVLSFDHSELKDEDIIL